MTLEIADFLYQQIRVGDGVSLNAAVAGAGTPIVLLHGFPQTHLMWRHVASDLAANHTVICPDLRGYGGSSKPVEKDESSYSKRTMGNDVVALAAALGHEKFALVGHDRGALVAFRTAMDHPDAVTHLGSLDVLPTLDMWNVMHGTSAAVGFHLYLMAQPPGLAETMIANSAEEFFGYFLDVWTKNPDAIPAQYRAAYLSSSAQAVTSIVADYRASAGIDVAHDQADLDAGNRLTMPVAVLQQDWGQALGFDAQEIWGAWASNLQHQTTTSGHFMAEENPAEITQFIRDLVAR